MTRKIRKNIESSFLHVLVQGVNKEFIFLENTDIQKYQSLLFKMKKQYDLKIIAYCIMHNHAHILLHAEESKMLSEFMRMVNISYARYYNEKYTRVGHVFRDRFKSEEIYTKEYLYNCINYIHKNPVKAGICRSEDEYEFSTFREFKEKNEIFCYIANSENIFIDTLEDRKQTCKEILEIFLKSNVLTKDELKKDKNRLKDLLKILKVKNQLSCAEIGNMLGISREKIRQVLLEVE